MDGWRGWRWKDGDGWMNRDERLEMDGWMGARRSMETGGWRYMGMGACVRGGKEKKKGGRKEVSLQTGHKALRMC